MRTCLTKKPRTCYHVGMLSPQEMREPCLMGMPRFWSFWATETCKARPSNVEQSAQAGVGDGRRWQQGTKVVAPSSAIVCDGPGEEPCTVEGGASEAV